jgi:hypothetical protein
MIERVRAGKILHDLGTPSNRTDTSHLDAERASEIKRLEVQEMHLADAERWPRS